LQIAAKDDLRVAAGLERMPELPQFVAQLDKIVDFAGIN
jgi:hypothetical protein